MKNKGLAKIAKPCREVRRMSGWAHKLQEAQDRYRRLSTPL